MHIERFVFHGATRKKSRVTFLESGRRNLKINGWTRPCRRCRGVSPSSNVLSLSHRVDLMRTNGAFVLSSAISGHISARLVIWSSLGSRNSRHERAISLNERPKENRACRELSTRTVFRSSCFYDPSAAARMFSVILLLSLHARIATRPVPRARIATRPVPRARIVISVKLYESSVPIEACI